MQTVLIVGGSHGIGAGIVECFSENGYKVIFTYRSHEKEAKELERQLLEKNFSVKAVFGDFKDMTSIESFLSNITNVDVLVINAAINHKKLFLDYSSDDFNYIMENNVNMPFIFCKTIASKWVKDNIKGKIINISSIRGETPQKGRVGYCCSKAALNMLTKCAAYELSEYGITVNAIAVGLTGLGMNEKNTVNPDIKWLKRIDKIPLKRLGNASDIGNVALFLANKKNGWITGQIINVDGGHQLVTF